MTKVNIKTSCTLLKPGSLFLFMVLFVNALHGQNYKFFKKTGYYIPFVVMIIQDTVFDDMNDRVLKSLNNTNASLLLINGSKIKSVTIKDTVNSILNSNSSISKCNVYLLIIGNKPFFEQQNQFLYDLFPMKYFVQTDNEDFNNQIFNKVNYHDFNLEAIFRTLGKYSLWQMDVEGIKNSNNSDCRYPHKEFGFGSSVNTNYPMRVRTDADLGKSFVSFGINGYRNINKNNKILAEFQFGFKKPSPNSGSTVMKGSTYISWLMEMQHLFYMNTKLKPLVGVGISYVSYMAMKGDMESMSSGNVNMEQNSFQFPGILLSAGFEYSIGEKTILVFKPAYNLSMGSFDKNSSTLNNFSMQFGLNFRILGKKSCFYEYLKLK